MIHRSTLNPRCHLVAAAVVAGVCWWGSIGCAGANPKNENPAIRPVGDKDAAMMPVDLTSDFDKVKEPKIGPDTWYASGHLQESQGNPQAAIAQYQQALKLNKEHHGALYRLGVLYATARNYPEAIAAWKRYIDATHHSAIGYSNLGFCHELADDPKAAERAYKTGIERDSDSAPCRVNYGLMLARHGRVHEGILQMQLVLTPAEVHFNVGSVHEGLGRKDLARAEYRKALSLNPKLNDAAQRLRDLDAVTAVNPAE